MKRFMDILLLALLHRSVIHWSNINLESHLTPNSCSQSLFFISKLFTFKLTSWLVLTRKLHSSTLPFKRLFSNHLNRAELYDNVSLNPYGLLMFSGGRERVYWERKGYFDMLLSEVFKIAVCIEQKQSFADVLQNRCS